MRAEISESEGPIIWSMALAPFAVTVLTLGADTELAAVAERVAAELERAGLDVLYDDRKERAGVKLNDADLIGIPLRIGVSGRGVTDASAEWKLRREASFERVPIAEIAQPARGLLGCST